MAAERAAAGKEKKPKAWTRSFRRLFRPFLTQPEKARIVAAVAEEEKRSSGKIHVQVIGRARRDILEIAKQRFQKLGLHNSPKRNDVLILISHLDHQFAIIGDEAFHAQSGSDFWERARAVLLSHFKERHYADGIVACVHEVGNELARHFPKDAVSDKS